MADGTPRGRFAPSPSGPLHLGSLVAAIGSFLDVKRQGGLWLLRMEDLDTPRVHPGAADAILRDLEHLGLHWDGAVLYQSREQDAYAGALERLRRSGRIYPCGCSRADFDGPYPGTCRQGLPPGREERAQRFLLREGCPDYDDRYAGHQCPTPQGDPVLLRADGPYAYVLASTVDDGRQGITEVVRGADLLPVTATQIQILEALGLPCPQYGHLPLVLGPDGRKLSKSAGSPPWSGDPGEGWRLALSHLGWDCPGELSGSPAAVWRDWAVERSRGWGGVIPPWRRTAGVL